MKTFIDTNILVYAFDISASDQNLRAKEIFMDIWQAKECYLSVQVLQEFFVTMTGKVKIPLLIQQAQEIIYNLSEGPIHSLNSEDVLAAIEIHRKYMISFWDAMIIRSANQLECEIILTEDLNNGQLYENIKIVNPFIS